MGKQERKAAGRLEQPGAGIRRADGEPSDDLPYEDAVRLFELPLLPGLTQNDLYRA